MTMGALELAPIERSGAVSGDWQLPDAVRDGCAAHAAHYRAAGFEPPWIGYVAGIRRRAVGGGGFVTAPRDGRVEIAYYTIAAEQGRGYATAIARALLDIARRADPVLRVIAHTLPEQNASTAILRKLGFTVAGMADDADAGRVWEWEHGGDAPLLLDVRPARAFAEGHLPGAQNIPLADLPGLLTELPRARRLVVCCDCGGQCEVAAQLLLDHGYDSVRALEGQFCVCRASRRRG